MSVALNNKATENEFPSAAAAGGTNKALLESPPMAIAEVNIYNASVFMQLYVSSGEEGGQATWEPEEFRGPSEFAVIRRYIFGIRFRSAEANTPAHVSAVLIPENQTFLAVLGVGAIPR